MVRRILGLTHRRTKTHSPLQPNLRVGLHFAVQQGPIREVRPGGEGLRKALETRGKDEVLQSQTVRLARIKALMENLFVQVLSPCVVFVVEGHLNINKALSQGKMEFYKALAIILKF